MSQHLKMFTDVQFTLVGFVIFFVLFLFFVAATWAPSQRALHKHLESLPLGDDSNKEIV